MREALQIGTALFKIHVLRKRAPLFLSWNITFRCNLRCKYCAACDAPRTELTTAEVLEGLDALWELGGRWITFGGGEPLIRDDIVEITRYAKHKGFHVYLSTNGWLLPSKADIVEVLDHVNLSLDGGKAVHDEVRGTGAFDKTMEALTFLKENRIHASLQCVINRYNVKGLDDAVDLARHHQVPIMFQPATKWLNTSRKENPIAPDTEAYREAIAHIKSLKRSGAPIRNSFTGLRHLERWPNPTSIFCAAGRGLAIIEADGSVLACHQCQYGQVLDGKTPGGGIREQFQSMTLPRNCAQCWCAPLVELCLVFSLHPEALYNAFRNG